VQVGAFGSASAAERLATELDGAGYTAYVAATRQGSKGLHRVRVGPVTDRAEADRLASRLRARGLPVAVVAND
jgi:cell division septation protein DedD